MTKRTISLLLILCLILSCVAAGGFSASAGSAHAVPSGADTDTADTAADYGLGGSCEDGNILQCFNWTLSQIKEELPNIAKAGFTCVQTSPLQPHDGNYQWYWLYQPTNFTVGNELGSLSDLQALCKEADKYGVKIIVDVVANHLAGSKNGSWSGRIDSSLRKSEYFHNQGECTDNNNRYDLTHKNIGMPDLNSEHRDIQSKVAAMVNTLRSAGVDGIRWDAAKHIGLPSEDCAFWTVMSGIDMYQYGEILDAPAGKSADEYNNTLMSEYAGLMGVTDEPYSAAVTTAIRDGRLSKSNGNWLKCGVGADRLVYWAESHDNYANNGWTNSLDQNVIDRAYAILGARADSQTLYLSRPYEKNDSSIAYGRKGSTHFTSKEVAAVNHFHNAMIGADEKYSTSGGCYVVCRSGGAVIVSPKGSDIDVTAVNPGGMVPAGTYTDEVSGGKWTVTADSITGHLGKSGIAVFYDPDYADRQVLVGDTDLSGDVSILDATYIQRYLVNLQKLNDTALASADTDRDGSVTIIDATKIQRYLVGLRDADSHVGEYIRG